MAFVYNLHVRNVNGALNNGLRLLGGSQAEQHDSRNGMTRVMPSPVVTIYDNPTERVLFNPVRNANPFFHLFEAMWMLSGRDDLPWLAQFNKQMATYSDDGGQTQPAAYGYRWRNYFGYDQLEVVVQELKRDSSTRRVVLAMWDGGDGDKFQPNTSGDLQRAVVGSKDIPCNTHCYFRVRNGKLDMTICCRSNDIVWGAYGANAVHFSVLLEYIAARVGVPVGTMYQVSNDFHYYVDIVPDPFGMADASVDLYATKSIKPMPMFADPDLFMADLPQFMSLASPKGTKNPPIFQDPFIGSVAVPMLAAWKAHKNKDYMEAERFAGQIKADDWRTASREWIDRRAVAYREKQNG